MHLQGLSFPHLFPETLALSCLSGSLLWWGLEHCRYWGARGDCWGGCLLQVTWHLISPASISPLPFLAYLLDRNNPGPSINCETIKRVKLRWFPAAWTLGALLSRVPHPPVGGEGGLAGMLRGTKHFRLLPWQSRGQRMPLLRGSGKGRLDLILGAWGGHSSINKGVPSCNPSLPWPDVHIHMCSDFTDIYIVPEKHAFLSCALVCPHLLCLIQPRAWHSA